MSKAQKIERKINDGFSDKLKAAVLEKLGIEIETNLNIFAMRMVSSRTDGKKLNKKQRFFMEAFERGYLDAMAVASEVKKP